MTIHVLVTSVSDEKFFIDLVASSCFVHSQTPGLLVDILVDAKTTPSWWKAPGEWLSIKNEVGQCTANYDLAIQLEPNQALAQNLQSVSTKNRTGVVLMPNLQVQGRWCQTFMAQLGCARFAPFTPFDLFNRILLGRTTLDLANPKSPNAKMWVIDVDTFPDSLRTWAEDLLKNLSLVHPRNVLGHLPEELSPRDFAVYIGMNSAASSWLAFHGCSTLLFYDGIWDAKIAPASSKGWMMPVSALPLSYSQITAILLSPENRMGQAFRLTQEYLGGLIPVAVENGIQSPTDIIDQLHYVVFNYLNDLLEVNLQTPATGDDTKLQLRQWANMTEKLVQLNHFGIKFLQDFLEKFAQGGVTDLDLQDLNVKITEIDHITDKTLRTWSEFDVLRLYFQFAKSAAQGDNLVDVAKSLILILHEASQVLQVYQELLNTTALHQPQTNSNDPHR